MFIILPNIHFRPAGCRLRDREVTSPFFFFYRQDSGSSWDMNCIFFSTLFHATLTKMNGYLIWANTIMYMVSFARHYSHNDRFSSFTIHK